MVESGSMAVQSADAVLAVQGPVVASVPSRKLLRGWSRSRTWDTVVSLYYLSSLRTTEKVSIGNMTNVECSQVNVSDYFLLNGKE